MHPATQAVLNHFRFEHLPPHLQEVSRPCAELARLAAENLKDDPEVTIGLRKLLEAKDCFVRAAVSAHGRHCNNDRPQEDYAKPWPTGGESAEEAQS